MQENQPSNVRLHAIIDGVVQGVGFRMFVLEEASRLGLTGWVRNLWDGKVEVTAEGPRSQLEVLLAKLNIGPHSAYVTEVKSNWEEATGEYLRFHVISTY